MDIKEHYPFVKCLHPRKVYNPYVNKTFLTGCGCCKACLLNRTRKMSLQCSIEEQSYKYTMFVTLTYSNDNVPLASFTPSYAEYYDKFGKLQRVQDGYFVVNEVERSGKYSSFKGDIMCHVPYDDYQVSNLQRKFNLNGYVPYVSLYDYQLFLKRFRKNLSKYTDEKIRFYGVSEYGPVHFRPHFHFLFFFDKKETFEAFAKCLSKSWTLGRFDSSLSRSKCSSYVAGYVNSRVNLPRVFENRALRPFSSHSKRFAQSFLQDKKAEIYENGPEYFSQLCTQVGNRYVTFMPWRSLASYYFPKCRKFGLLSNDELYTAYTVLLRAQSEYGCDKSLKEIARLIADDDAFTTTSSYFANFVKLRPFEDYRKDVDTIYHDLLLSRHFLYFVCDGNFSYSHICNMICKIVDYYKYVEYQQLTKWYEDMEIYSKEYGPSSLLLFYDFDVGCDSPLLLNWLSTNDSYIDSLGVHYPLISDFDLYSNELYQAFRSDVVKIFDKCIKHKKLNDLNKVFIY